MKLYTATGACGLHVQIVAREAGIEFDLEVVDLGNKKLANGEHLNTITPKGYIPAAVLDDGNVITEGVVISQWIAEQKPEAGLMPAWGTFDRLRVLEWAHYIGTELHKTFGPLFKPSSDEAKRDAVEAITARLGFVEERLANHERLVGERFTVVDAYLYNIMTWAKPAGVDLSPFPGLQAFVKRVRARPSVVASMEAEGLIKRAAA